MGLSGGEASVSVIGPLNQMAGNALPGESRPSRHRRLSSFLTGHPFALLDVGL